MVSLDGLKLIKYFEGCRLESYQDSGGIWTIGYGHTKKVYPNMIITDEEATHYLYEDLLIAETKVDRYNEIKLKQYQRDALISGAFNLSTRSIKKLIGYVNTDINIYLDKVLLYCHDSKGNKLLGLERRREAELLLFSGNNWNDIKLIIET